MFTYIKNLLIYFADTCIKSKELKFFFSVIQSWSLTAASNKILSFYIIQENLSPFIPKYKGFRGARMASHVLHRQSVQHHPRKLQQRRVNSGLAKYVGHLEG